MNAIKIFEQRLAESLKVKQAALACCRDDVVRAASLITDAYRKGNKLLLCGNGGSAADCQHVAAEFMSRLSKDFPRAALAAIALTTDSSFITAYANDCGWEGVFARQVEGLSRPGDVLLGISTSGTSGNVVAAFKEARARKVSTIALIGEGGLLKDLADVCISVPSKNTQHIQETHLAIEHIICEIVERSLFEEASAAG
ncbi:MAG: SIS domain-containing protein [Bdellovibrionota bacterium]|nr:MAG: SIS domain-containing protein [Bdellovibrionota bacterium]